MYPGKNDMPCSNTLAEIEYDGGGSYTPEEEDRIEQIKNDLALEKLENEADSPLKMLILKGDEKSLLKIGQIIRQSAIESARESISDDAWQEAFNQENAEF